MLPAIGLGNAQATLKVYIANRPNYSHYPALNSVVRLTESEIDQIGATCGNGWRKVFNVYAKFVFALGHDDAKAFASWQQYRDKRLLQSNSDTSLLFSVPDLTCNAIHIVMGRTYAKALLKQSLSHIALDWLDDEFAVCKTNKLIVCPYFDYRQLSNIKIIRLVELVNALPNPV